MRPQLKWAEGRRVCETALYVNPPLRGPQNQHANAEVDTFQRAASYAEGISRNPAFVDGNKRTACYVAADFLEQNGHQLQTAGDIEQAAMMELLGERKITRETAASHLLQCTQRVK